MDEKLLKHIEIFKKGTFIDNKHEASDDYAENENENKKAVEIDVHEQGHDEYIVDPETKVRTDQIVQFWRAQVKKDPQSPQLDTHIKLMDKLKEDNEKSKIKENKSKLKHILKANEETNTQREKILSDLQHWVSKHEFDQSVRSDSPVATLPMSPRQTERPKKTENLIEQTIKVENISLLAELDEHHEAYKQFSEAEQALNLFQEKLSAILGMYDKKELVDDFVAKKLLGLSKQLQTDMLNIEEHEDINTRRTKSEKELMKSWANAIHRHEAKASGAPDDDKPKRRKSVDKTGELRKKSLKAQMHKKMKSDVSLNSSPTDEALQEYSMLPVTPKGTSEISSPQVHQSVDVVNQESPPATISSETTAVVQATPAVQTGEVAEKKEQGSDSSWSLSAQNRYAHEYENQTESSDRDSDDIYYSDPEVEVVEEDSREKIVVSQGTQTKIDSLYIDHLLSENIILSKKNHTLAMQMEDLEARLRALMSKGYQPQNKLEKPKAQTSNDKKSEYELSDEEDLNEAYSDDDHASNAGKHEEKLPAIDKKPKPFVSPIPPNLSKHEAPASSLISLASNSSHHSTQSHSSKNSAQHSSEHHANSTQQPKTLTVQEQQQLDEEFTSKLIQTLERLSGHDQIPSSMQGTLEQLTQLAMKEKEFIKEIQSIEKDSPPPQTGGPTKWLEQELADSHKNERASFLLSRNRKSYFPQPSSNTIVDETGFLAKLQNLANRLRFDFQEFDISKTPPKWRKRKEKILDERLKNMEMILKCFFKIVYDGTVYGVFTTLWNDSKIENAVRVNAMTLHPQPKLTRGSMLSRKSIIAVKPDWHGKEEFEELMNEVAEKTPKGDNKEATHHPKPGSPTAKSTTPTPLPRGRRYSALSLPTFAHNPTPSPPARSATKAAFATPRPPSSPKPQEKRPYTSYSLGKPHK